MTDESEPEFDMDAALTRWRFLQEKINEAAPFVEEEKILRAAIFNAAFPKAVRTQNAKKVSFGFALVGKPRTNWKVDRALVENWIQDPEMKPLVEQVIDFPPKVRDGAFDALSGNEKGRIAAALTATPGTPELELKPEKSVRKYTA